jgi:hypothetical protein
MHLVVCENKCVDDRESEGMSSWELSKKFIKLLLNKHDAGGPGRGNIQAVLSSLAKISVSSDGLECMLT